MRLSETIFCKMHTFIEISVEVRKLSRRVAVHGVAAELEGDNLEHRDQIVESQTRERDESISSLNDRLNDTSVWGRGINRGGGRRGRWQLLC